MSRKLETDDWNFDDSSLDFSFEADIDGALNQSEGSKKKDRTVVNSLVEGAIDGAKDTLKSPAFYKQALRDALPSTYGTIAEGVAEAAEGSYKILDDTVKELKPRIGEITTKLDKLVPENQKTLKKVTEYLKKVTGVQETSAYGPGESQEDQMVTSSLAAIFEQNKQYTQIAERKQIARDRIGDKKHDQSVGILASIDANTKTNALYTTNVTQAYQKKSLELQLRTFSMQRDYFSKSVNYLEATKSQLEAVIKNTALPEYVKITNSERFMEASKSKLIDSLYEKGNPIARGMKNIRDRISGAVQGIGFGLDNFNYGLDAAMDAREQLEQMNEMLVSMGEAPLTSEQLAAAAATSAGLAKARDWVTEKIRARTEKMTPLKEGLAGLATKVLNPGAALKDFRESDKWQSRIGDYSSVKGSVFRFFDSFMDAFGDDTPARTIRDGGRTDDLNNPTMGFDNKAHISLVDIIPGHLAAIRREITMLRTGDTNSPLTVYDYNKREFVDQKTMDNRVRETVTRKSVGGMFNWELQSMAKRLAPDMELDAHREGDLKVFIAQLARVKDLTVEPEKIRETDAYQKLNEDTRKIVDLYLDNIENSEDKKQKIFSFTQDIRRARETMPSASKPMKDYIDTGHIDSLRKMGLLIEDPDGKVRVNEERFAEIQDQTIRKVYPSDINVKEAIKQMKPDELLKTVNERLREAQKTASSNKWSAAKSYEGIKQTNLYSWAYKKGEGEPGIKTGPMAQDIRRNLGEEVAPDGKAIDVQSMNGALMAAVQHLGSKVEAMSGEETASTGKLTPIQQIEYNTTELLRLNREAMEMAKASVGKPGGMPQGGPFTGDMSYGGLAGSLVGNVVSLATKVSSDIFAAAGKTYEFGKEEFAKPLAGFLSKAYRDNKDPVAQGIKKLFTKGTDFAGSVLDFGKKALTEHLPAGFRSVRDFATTTWKTIKDFFNETKDLYLPEGTEPVIRAVKLRMGFYRDAATGAVITTMDELLSCKNDIVDSAGNIVLTLEEKATGLYDKHGQKVKTFAANVFAGAVGGALWLKDKVKSGLGSLIEAGSGGLEGIKNMFKNKFSNFNFGDVGFGGKYIKSSYEVLVDIREIMLGGGKMVKDRLASEIGPQLPGSGTQSSGFSAKPTSMESAVKTVEKGVELAGKAKEVLDRTGVLGKVKSRLSSLKNVFGGKSSEEELVGPRPELVGPQKPTLQQVGASKIDSAKNWVKGLFNNGKSAQEAPVEETPKEPEVQEVTPEPADKKEASVRRVRKKTPTQRKKTAGTKTNVVSKRSSISPYQKLAINLHGGQVPDEEETEEVQESADKKETSVRRLRKKTEPKGRKTVKKSTENVQDDSSGLSPYQKLAVNLHGGQVPDEPEVADKKEASVRRMKKPTTAKKVRKPRIRKEAAVTEASVPEAAAVPEVEAPKEPAKKGFFSRAISAAKEEFKAVKEGTKEAYREVKKTVDERKKDGGGGEQTATPNPSLMESMSQKLAGLLKGSKKVSEEEGSERKGGVKEREEKIEKLHQSRQKEAAQLDPNVMNARAPDMMDGVNNGIIAGKAALGIGKIGGGIVSRMLDKTKSGRFLKAKGRGLAEKIGLRKKEGVSQEEADMKPEGPQINPDGTVTQKKDKGDKRSHASDSPDFIGPKLPSDDKKKKDKKAEKAEKTEKDPEDKEVIYDADGKKVKKPSIFQRVFGKTKKFSDSDGDGDRDGGVKDREEKLKKLEESRKKDPAALPQKEEKKGFGIGSLLTGIASVIGGLSSAVGILTKGFSGILSFLTKGFAGVFRLMGGLKGIGKGAGLVGKAVKLGVKGAWNVGKFALTRAAPALIGGALKLGGAALGGVASVLGSPVVLGAAAVAATGYGLYKGYKYLTRNNVTVYDKIRLRQYGFAYDEISEKQNHKFLALEKYLYDGRLKFDTGGAASIVEQGVKSEEILDIFDIDPEDKELAEKFTNWLGNRFKPFFLHHATTLYRINPKAKLDNIEKDLDPMQRVKYLETAGFPSGPYNVEDSPIKSIEKANTDADSVKTLIDEELKKITEEAKKKVAKEKDKFRLTPTTKKSEKETKVAEEVIKSQESKKGEKPAGDKAQKAAEVLGPTGEDGKVPDTPPSNTPEKTTQLSQSVKTAPGGILDGTGGREFVKLGKGMTENHLQGLHPGVLKLFLGMAEEYNKLTGKNIQMNEGLRTYEEQAALRQKYGNRAAKPGTSLHESGLAIDIPSVTAGELEKLGLMRKYGFTRPIGGEPWHMEPAGIQKNVKLARDDRRQADLLVEASPLRGGGGYAMVADAKKYGRNQALALSLLNREVDSSKMAEQPTTGDAMSRDTTAVAKAEGTGSSEGGGSAGGAGGTASVKPAEATETSSKSTSLPSPQELNTMRGENADKPEAKTVAQNTPQPAKDNSVFNQGAGGGMEKPSAGESSSSSTPISGRGGEGVKEIIESSAKKVGIDPKTMLTFAAVESDMNPNAKAKTSSASGLFQFINSTWKEMLAKFGKKHGLDGSASPLDPKASSLMAAEYLKQNSKIISSVKPNPNATDLYLTHFLGAGGARKFLSIPPDQRAAEVMPEAANSNRNIFFDKGGQPKATRAVYDTLSEKLKKKSTAYGIDLQVGSMGSVKAANSDFVKNVESAPTAPKFGTTGPVETGAPAQESPKYGTVDKAPQVAPSTPSANDPSVMSVGNQQSPPTAPVSGESKDPIRSEGGGVFLDPMGGSRQAYEARSKSSDISSPALNSMDATLKSSLEVQRESLDVLKAIMGSISPEAFAKALGGAAGQKSEEKNNPLKEADRRNLGTFKRDQNPTLDLSRKVA